jgi:glucuronoarabinoxylan endo-1,4-beta-xylanase
MRIQISNLPLPLITALVWLTAAGGARADSVTIEAESGTLGADWAVSNSASPVYITILSNGVGGNPGSAARVASYTVPFPAAGTYELYAHVRVGPDTFNDDSFFYGNGFGQKSATSDADWILVNGLGSGGYTAATNIVAGVGSAGGQVWKWVNLSEFTNGVSEPPITFSVAPGNLSQAFQIGAREDGLWIDKFVFAPAGAVMTVSNLDNGTGGTLPSPAVTIDPSKTCQTIEGFGGATAFYAGWIKDHPYQQEIYTNAFAGLNLSMLRLGDWYRYQTPVLGFDAAAADIVSNANRVLGHPVPVLISSWAPPAFLKSNGQVGNGGTLAMTNGGFAYTNFANYWYDSLMAYQSNGITPTWISIQNEPDWAASYDSCVFHPTEDTVNGTNYASYSKALDAVFQRLTNLPAPPRILAPEVVGIGYNDVQNYAATMNGSSFYGVAHHLYHGSTDGTPAGYIGALQAVTNVFPSKPRFMTEYGLSNMVDAASLMHYVLTVEQAGGYNFWSLVWPPSGIGLVQIENPYNRSSWTNAPPGTSTQSHGWWLAPSYWSMKHFSYFITPGFKRVTASSTDPTVLASAFLSPDGLRLVSVLINTSSSLAFSEAVNSGPFAFTSSSVYQTAGANYFQSLGPLGTQLVLPPSSLTTLVMDKQVSSMENPLLTLGATTTNITLAWPLAYSGYSVQSRTNLLLGNWLNVTSPTPQSVGQQWQVSFPLTGTSPVFYRLIK